MDYKNSMITTVTQKNMVSIPAVVGRHYGIKPGFQLDWQPTAQPGQIAVHVIPSRELLARQLLGVGKKSARRRHLAAELVRERASEG